MEFGKAKGFWTKATTESDDVIKPSSMTKHNTNNNNNDQARLEILEEIKPETTSEGYGLRTPYGTHLNLDFVKYCEDLGQNQKRNLMKSRQRTTSSTGSTRQRYGHPRLSSGQSSDSLDFPPSEDLLSMAHDDPNHEHTLMETRRRLEAYRSFRSKRNKSSGDNMLHSSNVSRVGYVASGAGRDPYGSTGNGYGLGSNGHVANDSPCSSSSGRETPSGLIGASSGSQVTPQHLQIVREQMASALVRLKELEEQVKTIPILQVKISVLQQEKKHLLEELKLRSDQISPGIESSQALKLRRNPALSSSSSGVSSSSLQSSYSSQTSESLLQKSSVESHGLSKDVVPPCPPKRKYRSVGIGDEIPLKDIICYHDGNDASKHPLYNPPPRKESVDFSSIVKQIDIDSAFNIFPPTPPQSADAGTLTERKELRSSSFQTDYLKNETSSTQTPQTLYKNVGCDAKTCQMIDNYCMPMTPDVRDVSVMVRPPLKSTKDQSTSSKTLIKHHHKKIGVEVQTATSSTETHPIQLKTQQTSCDGLILYQDTMSGPDRSVSFQDAAVTTDPPSSRNVAINCSLPLQIPKVLVDKMTMTLSSGGRWVSYSDMTSVACGDNSASGSSSKAVSTNTDTPLVQNQSTETVSTLLLNKSTLACIRPISSNVSTNTSTVLKYNRSTDCSEIQPVLRHNASNTVGLKTKTASTQYAMNRSNLVDCTVNTDIVKTSNAETSTDDLGHTKNIDAYVDKVQSLLEEQQSLLAENYEVFTEEWDGKSEKVSRYVNPGFAKSECTKEENSTGSLSPSAVIEASLSLMESKTRKDSSSSASDSSSDDEVRPILRPLPSFDSDMELKSIMKKPGTPSGTKKFLRFAEGVKSDDDDSLCSCSDESWDEEDGEEESNKEHVETTKKEEKETTVREEKETIKEESNEPTIKPAKDLPKKEDPKPEPKNSEFNYSNEFVKKPSETTAATDQHMQQQEELEEDLKQKEDMQQPLETPNLGRVPDEENATETIVDPVVLMQPAKYIFTTQVLDACDLLEKHLRNPKLVEKSNLVVATSVIQQEWFRVAAQDDSTKRLLDDFITDLADTSLPVLRKVVNMTDASGNTVLHYAISHGNILVVDSLLSIEELDVNKANQAGYTSAMLAALCDITSDMERKVFKNLFSKSNINAHAKEAGQTALMLAVSHGRLHTAQLLLSCGAEINARDEDGSTALMCAVEHDQLEAVKLLLSKPNCDATIADMDGSTALNIAMDGGHSDIAILLYAQQNFKSNTRSARPRTACKSMIPSPMQKPIKS